MLVVTRFVRRIDGGDTSKYERTNVAGPTPSVQVVYRNSTPFHRCKRRYTRGSGIARIVVIQVRELGCKLRAKKYSVKVRWQKSAREPELIKW